MGLASGVSGLYLVGVTVPVFLTVFRGSYGDIKYGWLTGGIALCEAICIGIKEYVKQPRPNPLRCGKSDNEYGMPSSHTALVFYLLGFFAVNWFLSIQQQRKQQEKKKTDKGALLPPPPPPPMPQGRTSWKKKKRSMPSLSLHAVVCSVLLCIGCFMGWSRVSLGCHTLGQVFAGVCVGFCLGAGLRAVMPSWQWLSKLVSDASPGKNGDPKTLGAALLAAVTAATLAYDIDFSKEVLLHGWNYKSAAIDYVELGLVGLGCFCALGGSVASSVSVMWPIACMLWLVQYWVCARFRITGLSFVWNAMLALTVVPYAAPVLSLRDVKRYVGIANLLITLVAMLYALGVDVCTSNGATKDRNKFFTMLSQIFGINAGIVLASAGGYIGYFYKAKGIKLPQRRPPQACNCRHNCNHNHNNNNNNNVEHNHTNDDTNLPPRSQPMMF